jgi:hypothetical protein
MARLNVLFFLKDNSQLRVLGYIVFLSIIHTVKVIINAWGKGLEPKLHDMALSMGENKTLNLKVVTLLKYLQDIMLSTSISNFV